MTDNESSNVRGTVSLICTVYNEVETISAFVESIFAMTMLPSEFIIVDGGSTDGTIRLLQEFAQKDSRGIIRLIIDPSCNIKDTAGPIAKGRNLAIKEAQNEIIACTDAGCTVDRYWLWQITRPLLNNPAIDVVGGWYLPDARSFFERCVGLLFVLPPASVNEQTFIPSSRSIAFRKRAWEAVGGYSEVSLAGEDTKFVLDMRKKGVKFQYVGTAIVFWRMRSTLRSFLRLIRKYGFGDGFLSILPANTFKSLLKITVPLVLLFLILFQSVWFLFPLILFWWVMPFRKRIRDAIQLDVVIKLPVLGFLQFMTEIAYLQGYIMGKLTTIHPLTAERQ